MKPLSLLYGTAVRLRNSLYNYGTIPARWLHGPVVSVGNLAVGGSGKTPFLILLGGLLKQRGIPFDVLSRGYGRATKGVAEVDPTGSPRDFGDEPVLIARKLQVPVIVAENRYAAGQWAEEKFGPQLHLLDDGFQHRQLGRDFDIVLVRDRDAADTLLPAGRLREPIKSLRRANVVVLTNDTTAAGLGLEGTPIWRMRRGIAPIATTAPCFAFCGIARPAKFFEQLKAAGVAVSGTQIFRDHHAYTDADVARLLELRRQNKAAEFVTTEKDAINLGSGIERLQPLHIAQVTMELENADAAMQLLLHAISKRKFAAP